MKNNAFLSIMLGVMGLVLAVGAAKSDIDIAQVPLFSSIQPEPNLMVTVDDSRTMDNNYMPEDLARFTTGDQSYYPIDLWRVGANTILYSAQTNAIAYDPRITYKPWVRYDGQDCENADPTAIIVDQNAPLYLCLDKNDPNYPDETPTTIDMTAGGYYAPYIYPSVTDNAIIQSTADGDKNYPMYFIYTGDFTQRTGISTDMEAYPNTCSGYNLYLFSTPQPNPCLPDSYVPVVITPDIDHYAYEYLIENITKQIEYWDSYYPDWINPNVNIDNGGPANFDGVRNQLGLLVTVSSVPGSPTITSTQRSNLIQYEDRSMRTDCVGGVCTYDQEIRNYANWFVYHRLRRHAVQSAIGRAIAKAFVVSNRPIRIGFATTSYDGYTDTGYTDTNRTHTNTTDFGGKVKLGVRRFAVFNNARQLTSVSVDNRKAFFNDNLYSYVGSDIATGLKETLNKVGGYFKNDGNTGPWSNNPEISDASAQLSCRQNYNVLVTDGYNFNESDQYSGTPVSDINHGNVDGDEHPPAHTLDGVSIPGPMPAPPYRDDWPTADQAASAGNPGPTLADYAMYYWLYDLRTDMDNTVPKTSTGWAKDDAFWQHLVTYTVGLGISGTLTPNTVDNQGNLIHSADFDALVAGTKQWPDPAANLSLNFGERIDDLWHAAVNGRGNYLSAQNPQALASSLDNVIQTIVLAITGSSASVATNSTRLNTGAVLYQAKFDTTNWTGKLLAYCLDVNGEVGEMQSGSNQCASITGRAYAETDALWEAGSVLSGRLKPDTAAASSAGRMVYSYNRSIDGDGNIVGGIVFAWDNLSTEQQSGLDPTNANGSNLVSYFKGSEILDANGNIDNTNYRERVFTEADGTKKFWPLGDIVNSDPWFVGAEDFGYYTLPEGQNGAYQAFQNSKIQATVSSNPRLQMVYVGGNDGMLHAFQAAHWDGATMDAGKRTENDTQQGNGSEIFAYIPGSIVKASADQGGLALRGKVEGFTHKYLVDGAPRAGDAYFNSAWHTVLVGSTGAGGYYYNPENATANKNKFGSVFALDVTNPMDFANDTDAATANPDNSNAGGARGASKILWEFTKEDDPESISGYSHGSLGVPMAKPTLARLQNGAWAAIIANGYDGEQGLPVLYLLDLSKKPCTDHTNDCGFIIKKFSPCYNNATYCPSSTMGNGLSSPVPVDVDGDRRVDYVYAGDLLGNLWKFDLTCASSNLDKAACASEWKVAYGGSDDHGVGIGGRPLFTACDDSTNPTSCSLEHRQPITEKPQVGNVGPEQTSAVFGQAKQNASLMVYFGTGKYLEGSDTDSKTPTQSFYGLWDKNTDTQSAGSHDIITNRSKLQQQEVLSSACLSANNQPIRLTTNTPVCYKDSCDYPASSMSSVDSDCQSTTINLSARTVNQQQGWYLDLIDYPGADPSGERSVSTSVLVNGNIVFTSVIPSSDQCKPGGTSWIMELNALTGQRGLDPPLDTNADHTINSADMVGGIPPSGLKSSAGILTTPAVTYGPGKAVKCFSGSTGVLQCVSDAMPMPGVMSWQQLR